MHRHPLIPIVVLLAACGNPDSGAPTCLDQYAAADGYSFEGEVQGCGDWVEETDPGCTPPTVDDIEAECAADGHSCADGIVVTHDAALCIAREDGLAEGLVGIRAQLIYDVSLSAPKWSAWNVLEDDGEYSMSGESVAVDARDGSVVGHADWSATP